MHPPGSVACCFSSSCAFPSRHTCCVSRACRGQLLYCRVAGRRRRRSKKSRISKRTSKANEQCSNISSTLLLLIPIPFTKNRVPSIPAHLPSPLLNYPSPPRTIRPTTSTTKTPCLPASLHHQKCPRLRCSMPQMNAPAACRFRNYCSKPTDGWSSLSRHLFADTTYPRQALHTKIKRTRHEPDVCITKETELNVLE